MNTNSLKLSAVERLQLRAGGYHPASVARFNLDEVEPILKQGTSVLWAASVTGATWALAGWGLTPGLGPLGQSVAAAGGFVLGSSMVLTFDSGFLYASDTTHRPKLTRMLAYGAFRMAMIIAISTITSQYTVPWVLGDDLATQKQVVVQTNDLQRREAYTQSAGLAGLQGRVGQADQEVADLRRGLDQLPNDMQHRWDQARKCGRAVEVDRQRLRERHLSDQEIRAQLADARARCAKLMKASVEERSAHLKAVRERLGEAESRREQASNVLQAAENDVEQMVQSGRNVDQKHLGVHSQKVLWSLLISNPAALAKWLTFSLVLLLCELLPLLQKLQAGQSVPGRTLANERKLKHSQVDAMSYDGERAANTAQSLCALEREAWDEAQRDATVRQARVAQRIRRIKAQDIAMNQQEAMEDLVARDRRMTGLAENYALRRKELEALRDKSWAAMQDALTT